MICRAHGQVELVPVDITALIVVANYRFKFHKRRQLFIRTHNAVIRVYDEARNVIETHEHTGELRDW